MNTQQSGPQSTGTPTTVSSPSLPPFPGFNVLLMGAIGTGKTHSILSLPQLGVETFVIFTEPSMGIVQKATCDEGLHYHYIEAARPTWDELIFSANQINQSFDFEALAKKKDWKKSGYQQFLDFLHSCNNFKCDRCGQEFGSIDDWGNERAFVVDSLSGLSIMAMDLVVGSKPVKALPDWGVAMDNLERVITRLCMSLSCHLVLTSHLEREKDEVTGGINLMASTLGTKLSPKLPRYFDEVIMAKHDGVDYSWANQVRQAEVKHRYLPGSEKLTPDFTQLLHAWKAAERTATNS